VRVASFHAVRRRLVELGASHLGVSLQRNDLYDGRDLAERGCRLRLRTVRRAGRGGEGGAPPVLTFKGPRRAGPFKSRRELEVGVSDRATARRLLEAMGYRKYFSFDKRRESWRLGEWAIELDEVPLLGRFVEVETPDAREVALALAALRLDGVKVIKRGYTSLLRRHLRENGIASRRVRFRDLALAA
ncbi:MAG: class IV adenylate cyclase, partial [Candidatus Rokubacteria bacterium]|nr:class IV adenylate cyclase [Candidatus Rokubacteria bacterium]